MAGAQGRAPSAAGHFSCTEPGLLPTTTVIACLSEWGARDIRGRSAWLAGLGACGSVTWQFLSPRHRRAASVARQPLRPSLMQ